MATAITTSFASGFDIVQIELGPGAKGRVLALKFSSRLFPSTARASFYVVNVYLQSGCSNRVRMAQLNSIEILD